MQDFKDLKVWEKSHAMVLDVYRLTRAFPKEELYGLTSQLRRASVSIPSNIAEGCGRGSDADFARFLKISMGSACELEYLLFLAVELEMLKNENFKDLSVDLVEVKKMLTGLLKKLKAVS